ncbi:TonB-dependent receptor [Blastomonas sp. SL216]|uniref:TonB-dependent receptor n=1 Tax=Blastomonas sp. SL216 TaxID=2995169 RepID=UPI0023773204|nr:TonB-dependent receptor [Blastomonas sp. SL216]
MLSTNGMFTRASSTALAAVLAFATPGLALAQDADALEANSVDEEGGDVIVVTALRRSTNVQETPLAITAVSAAQLSQMGINDSNALAKASPGLIVREGGFSGTRLTIRNIRAAGEATVGLYFDETPVQGSSGTASDAGGTTPDIRLFDVERVEVLRGPQGTLYGSSSMAGAVRLILNKPQLNDTELVVTGQVSGVEDGGVGFETQAMINLPIIADMLAVRIVGFQRERPGYVDNIRLGRSNINSQSSEGGRIIVRFRPASNLTIDGFASLQNSDGFLNDYFLAAGPYINTFESQQPVSDKNTIYSGTLTWDADFATLTVVGAHAKRNFNYSFDTSAFFRAFGANFPVGSPTYNAFMSQAPSVANSPQLTKTDTLEARISGGSEQGLQWTAGYFYSDRKGDFASNIARSNPGDGSVLPVAGANLLGQRLIEDDLKQQAGFAEGTFAITPELSVTAGARYFHYERRVKGAVSVPNAFVGFIAGAPTDQSSSENGWLYKANISYQATPDLLLYATASSGQRPGGVNQNVSLPAVLQTYSSDQLWNYEFGVKTSLFDDLLVLNADVFQIDWSNMQTSGTLPNTNFGFIANAGRARARGMEVETTITPVAGLQFQISSSYIDAKLREDQSNQSLLAPGLKGDDIPSVPKFTIQGAAQYGWELSGATTASLRADVYHQSSTWTEFRHTNVFQRFLPSNTLVSLRASVAGSDGGWSIGVFVNNLLNSDTVVSKASANIFGGLNNVRAISNVPRTIGLDVTKRF